MGALPVGRARQETSPPARRGRADRGGTRRAIAIGPIVVGAVLLALAAALPLLRQEGVRSWETIWAEDGAVYFQQAHDEGGLAVLLRGYAGYLQLPPRLIAAPSPLVPLPALPAYFAVAGTVVSALLAAFTYRASAGWVRSRAVRLALASLVALMPALGDENTANATNTIWAFAMVAPWALVSFAEDRTGVVLRSVVGFLAATATVASAVFVPLALGQLLLRRTRASWVVAGAFAAGLAVQGAVVLSTTDEAATLEPTRDPGKLATLLGVRVFAEYLIGDRAIAALWAEHAPLLVVVPAAVVALLLVLLARRTEDRRRVVLAGVFFALAATTFAALVWTRGTNAVVLTEADARSVIAFTSPPSGDPDRVYRSGQLRYSVVPVMLLASATAVLVSGATARRLRGARAQLVRGLYVAHVVVLIVTGFQVTIGRSNGPAWSDSVDAAFRNQCGGEVSDGRVAVPTSRLGAFPIELSCRELAP